MKRQRIYFFSVSCALIFSAIVIVSTSGVHALQQSDADEHASHHPEAKSDLTSKTSQDLTTANGSSMMGPAMGKQMDRMMEKMGAPKPKDLYPTLMRMHDMTPEQQMEVLQKATSRMEQGTVQLTDGFESLAIAADRDDLTSMQDSLDVIKEGIAHFDSGLAAKRAIQDGQEPRRVALTWFKSQMNILPSSPTSNSNTLFGMTPLHSAIMFILLGFVSLMFYIYGVKMRRASALLGELKHVETSHTTVVKENSRRPTAVTDIEQVSTDTSLARQSMPSDRNSRKAAYVGDVLVIGIFRETHDVKTFRLALADGQELPFDYEPGQFVTFTLDIKGFDKPVKRSYTIASSPTERNYFEVTIKREEHGTVSRYMHDTVNVGDMLTIKAPGGKFYFNGREATSVVLISGGVGITPMMSAVRYLTSTCWSGEIYFLFCTRTTNDFIFEQELRYLQARHPNLKVLVSMTQADGTSWMGPQGRFSSNLVNEFVPEIALKTAHICGPPAMMDAMTSMLLELGMPNKNIKKEAFGSGSSKKALSPPTPASEKNGAVGKNVVFSLSNVNSQAGPDQTVLDVADDVDVEIENSCRAGSCGSCKVKLLRGDVDMDVDDGLEPEDKASGYILACQAVPKTDVEVEA
ncbi:FAD-binding oxidoreductase [Alteromonas mediterranea]|uniref:FAD-binding oxidoreductase n=1 Tax=Alteromonas mediterranea TaxID=314275 RepID=UPI002FDF0DBB